MGFRKAQTTRIGGKFLVFGKTHEGKSWFGLTCPSIACLDSEAGLAFDEGKDIVIGGKTYNNLLLVNNTSDLDELEESLDSIIEGELEGVETLMIDSETKFYNTMDISATEVEEKKARANGKAVDARAKWSRIKNISMKLQQAKITASAKGIHIVSTAQGLDLMDDNNKVVGHKPDVHKQLPFDYDVILRFYTEIDKNKDIRYFAEVVKDRTHATKVGSIIENCTFDIWKPVFDERKSGKSMDANYSQDLKDSVKSVLNGAELSHELGIEIIAFLKDNKGDRDKINVVKEKLDELNIDIKQLDTTDVDVLKQLISFLKTLK